MNIPVLILAVGAGLTFLAGTISTLIAVLSADPKLQKQIRNPVIICIILAIAFSGASYYFYQVSVPATPSPSSPSSQTTSTASTTPSATVSPTPLNTPGTAPTALAVDGTNTVHTLLTCSTCSGGNDPIRLTIDSIAIDNANGRSIWNGTLNNVSGTSYTVINQGMTIQTANSTQSVQGSGYTSVYMNPGEKKTIQCIFTTTLYTRVAYIFTAHLGVSDASVTMPFDPATFTFPITSSISQGNSDTTQVADGTISKHTLLTCSTCSGGNDPIRLMIDSITVDNTNGRSIWNATLNNVSGTTYTVINQGMVIQTPTSTQSVQATGYTSIYMNPGEKKAVQFIFSFALHKGVPYTFTAHLGVSDASVTMPFDSVTFTF